MRHIFTCALFLAALTDGARASDTHLIPNRSYEYFPLPNYGGPDECDECKDEDDTSQLTDGFTHYTAGTIWHDKPTVGWSAGVNVPVVIWFDLGEPATLSELRFGTTGGDGAGVVDVGLPIFVSRYVIAGERPRERKNSNRPRLPEGMGRCRAIAIRKPVILSSRCS